MSLIQSPLFKRFASSLGHSARIAARFKLALRGGEGKGILCSFNNASNSATFIFSILSAVGFCVSRSVGLVVVMVACCVLVVFEIV